MFLPETKLPMTACALYALLLHRALLSQKNGWADELGRIYILYPIDELCKTLKRGRTAVKAALAELEAADLLERRHQGRNLPNRLYVKLSNRGPETRSPGSRKTGEGIAGKAAASKHKREKCKERNRMRDYAYFGEDSL